MILMIFDQLKWNTNCTKNEFYEISKIVNKVKASCWWVISKKKNNCFNIFTHILLQLYIILTKYADKTAMFLQE